MKVLVAQGTTPAGVGLVLVENRHGEWDFRLTSPCCGALFANRGYVYVKSRGREESISAFCEGCDADYSSYMFKCGSTLYHDYPATGHGSSSKEASSWVARALGYPNDGSLEITVE